MDTLFTATIKIDKQGEDGCLKKVSEEYLINAVTHADAEERVVAENEKYCKGEMDVAKVSKTKISEVFKSDNTDEYKFYKVRCAFIEVNEKTGEDKRQMYTMLVMGSDISNALKNFENGMRGTLADYEVESIALTKILDYFE